MYQLIYMIPSLFLYFFLVPLILFLPYHPFIIPILPTHFSLPPTSPVLSLHSHSSQPSSPNPLSHRGEIRNLGKPVALCKQYYDAGADEVVFLNITSFRQGKLTLLFGVF